MYMADWEPIQATRVQVVGISAESEHLLDVAVHLSSTPPNGWSDRLKSCANISVDVNLRATWRIQGSQVRMHVSDADLEAWVEKTKECIARANELYESEILPGVKQREEAQRTAQSERERRLADARRRAEGL
jgi:hypothetical protein